MKLPSFRDVPPRAAALVIVLALVASVVTGSPWSTSPQPAVQPVARAEAPAAEGAREPLDLENLERRKSSGTVPDLFANRAVAVPISAPVQVVSPVVFSAPQTVALPALPFRYLGRMDDGEHLVVFLEGGQSLYSVGIGDTVGQVYRIETISDTAVTFRHLKLNVAQTLAIPANPKE